MSSFYTEEELKGLGLASYGENVLISRNCQIYGAKNISIGNNVRIDDFCILSGKITLGSNIHISAAVLIFAGDAGVSFDDFSGISSRSAIYAATDDYSGKYMTNPTVPEEFRGVTEAHVHVGRHSLIGTGCTVLPGVTVGDGARVGAMSLVNKSLEPNTLNIGIPCKKFKDLETEYLELEKQYVKKMGKYEK